MSENNEIPEQIERAFARLLPEDRKKMEYNPTGPELQFFCSEWCEKCLKQPISPHAKGRCNHLFFQPGEHNGKWFRLADNSTICTAFKNREDANRQRRRDMMEGFKIIIDTREQKPYSFRKIKPRPGIIKATLHTGDYSLPDFQDQFCIERKSLPDLFGSVGSGRKRFEKEFDRMSKMEFAGLVIESNFQDMFRFPPRYSKMNPKAVFRTVLSWQMRYGVHVYWCVDRAFAEKITYILAENFYKRMN